MVNMRIALAVGVTMAGLLGNAALAADPVAPQVKDVATKDGVKTYLLSVSETVLAAAKDFKTAAEAYDKLVGTDPVAAAKAKPAEVGKLIDQMRDAYQRIDSFGYEYVEGIVAGVPSLAKYDVELDSGLPKKLAASPDDVVADVVIKGPGFTLDKEGSLNNFLIEPTVFGTNDAFIVGKVELPGFDKPVGLPKPGLPLALANYAVDGYTRMLTDCRAWTPTDKDCFAAVFAMTPTLADYFDEWKEAKKDGSAPGGRFVAVSRVSDMRGIMSSVRLTWQGLEKEVKAKDAALADSISDGYVKLLAFVDDVDARDKKAALTVEAIDALGSQAKDRADKLTAQTAQAAALLGVDVNAQ